MSPCSLLFTKIDSSSTYSLFLLLLFACLFVCLVKPVVIFMFKYWSINIVRGGKLPACSLNITVCLNPNGVLCVSGVQISESAV